MSCQRGPQIDARWNVFHPVLPSDALRDKPVRVTIAGEHFALFRGEGGRPAAVRDRCPHRFAALSGGRVREDGRLACPYHGWHFDAEGHGVSPTQPSLKKCDVEALRVEEFESYLWLGHKETPRSALPPIRPTDPDYEFGGTFSVSLDAAIEHAVDIFSDVEHPAWVHGRLGWSEDQIDEIRYEHSSDAHSTSARAQGPQRSTWLSRLLGLKRTDRFNNHWTTRFDPVRNEFHLFWTDAHTGERRPLSARIVVFFVPVAERKTDLHVFVYASINHVLRRVLLPIVKKVLVYAAHVEAKEDRKFLKNMLDAPTTPKGMRLGMLDGVIVPNRHLLSRVYYREIEDAKASGDQPHPESGVRRGRALELAK